VGCVCLVVVVVVVVAGGCRCVVVRVFVSVVLLCLPWLCWCFAVGCVFVLLLLLLRGVAGVWLFACLTVLCCFACLVLNSFVAFPLCSRMVCRSAFVLFGSSECVLLQVHCILRVRPALRLNLVVTRPFGESPRFPGFLNLLPVSNRRSEFQTFIDKVTQNMDS
jgi:hypothetical protein